MLYKLIAQTPSPSVVLKPYTPSNDFVDNRVVAAATLVFQSIHMLHQTIHEYGHKGALLLLTDISSDRILMTIGWNPFGLKGGSVIHALTHKGAPLVSLPGIHGEAIDPNIFTAEQFKTLCAFSCADGAPSLCISGGFESTTRYLGLQIIHALEKELSFDSNCDSGQDVKIAYWLPSDSLPESFRVNLSKFGQWWQEQLGDLLGTGVSLLEDDDKAKFGLYDAAGVLAQLPVLLSSMALRHQLTLKTYTPAHLKTHFIDPQTREERLQAIIGTVTDKSTNGLVNLSWKAADALYFLNCLWYTLSGVADFEDSSPAQRLSIIGLLAICVLTFFQHATAKEGGYKQAREGQIESLEDAMTSGNPQEAWELLTILSHEAQSRDDFSSAEALKDPQLAPFIGRFLVVLGFDKKETQRLLMHGPRSESQTALLLRLDELLNHVPPVSTYPNKDDFPSKTLCQLLALR